MELLLEVLSSVYMLFQLGTFIANPAFATGLSIWFAIGLVLALPVWYFFGLATEDLPEKLAYKYAGAVTMVFAGSVQLAYFVERHFDRNFRPEPHQMWFILALLEGLMVFWGTHHGQVSAKAWAKNPKNEIAKRISRLGRVASIAASVWLVGNNGARQTHLALCAIATGITAYYGEEFTRHIAYGLFAIEGAIVVLYQVCRVISEGAWNKLRSPTRDNATPWRDNVATYTETRR